LFDSGNGVVRGFSFQKVLTATRGPGESYSEVVLRAGFAWL
jgi:hypothetical protein